MKVLTAVTNNPDFIEIQYYTLKKYLKNDYEFIVFNDAKPFPDFTNGDDPSIYTKIQDTCNKLGIKCINLTNEHHAFMKNAAWRCADAMNYILRYQLVHPDEYLVIDSDMFLIDDFDISKYREYDAAISQENVLNGVTGGYTQYPWNGIYYFNIPKMKHLELIDWACGIHDVGGLSKHWIQKLKDTNCFDRIHLIKRLRSCEWNLADLPENLKNKSELIKFMEIDPRKENGNFFCEIFDNVFFHYRAGGNWRGEGLHNHKMLTNVLKQILLN